VVLALALTACGSSGPRGTVTGTARIQEGGVEVVTVAGHATVTVRQGDRLVASTKATSGRTFILSVPPGSYEIGLHCAKPMSGVSVGLVVDDQAHITIRPGKTSHVNLRCLINAGVG